MERMIIGRMALVVAAIMLALASCKGYKQIPDDTLADIFRDMYLQNAYIEQHPLNMSLDSVDVYAPLIERYGYTEDDFKRTIIDATRRKSFRLTDIVDAAIAKLEAQDETIRRKVWVMEQIDSMAKAVSTKEIFRCDSVIKLRSMADSSLMTLRVPIYRGAGTVGISYYYMLDSLDGNRYPYNRHKLLSADGETLVSSSFRMTRDKHTKYETMLQADGRLAGLELTFGNYPEKPKRIMLTIDSIVVTHYPTMEEARKILSYEYSYRLMINGKEYYEYIKPKADSSALRIPSPLVDSQCDSLVVE